MKRKKIATGKNVSQPIAIYNNKSHSLKNYKRISFVAIVITGLIFTFSQCINTGSTDSPIQAADPRGRDYAGAATCAKCHKNIHDTWITAAHTNSSAVASLSSVKGSFEAGKNVFHYRPNLKVMMEQRQGIYQVAYLDNKERQAYPFNIVIGSGRKAQAYLFWLDDNVFQLPVSYSVKVHNWVNSPSYPPDKVRFDRLINVGCFECHGSYIKLRGTQQEGSRLVDYFDRTQIIYGIDCERCHGPAARHVAYQETHPREKTAHYITAYTSLARQAKMELCAQCHSGAHREKNSIFYFKPGDSLAAFFASAAPVSDPTQLDVHGNQYQLTIASRCYLESKSLTCATCHNVHVKERDNLVVFAKRCLSCHNTGNHNTCKMAPSISKDLLINKCVDCHMPATPSRNISMKSENETDANPNYVRTHYISIYPDIAKKIVKGQW